MSPQANTLSTCHCPATVPVTGGLRRAAAVRRVGAAVAAAPLRRRRVGIIVVAALRHGEVHLGAERRVLDDHILCPLEPPLTLCLLRVLRVDARLLLERS